ncbi:MAG TPA: serine hydrolase domain-containing protein [Steroidobacteraceae bacterium]|nr:serine hydrolase domain-containing protein [Steroidobacteraceae bacterium]
MSASSPPSLIERLDAALTSAVDDRRVVGAAVCVAHRGERIYSKAAGLANRETQQPMALDTLVRLASITKPFVTAATLALIERGTFRLDDAIDKYLPEFKPRLASGVAPTISIRHLLTHTSGLNYGFQEMPDGPYHRANVSDGIDQPGLSFQENLRRLVGVPLIQEPGGAWRYSVALDVLGAVIERATGKSLPAITAEFVTRPLSMHDTSFRVVDKRRLASAYVDGKPPTLMTDPQIVPFGPGAGISFSTARAFDEGSFPSAGAGMIGSAEDTLRFLECIRRGGAPILSISSAQAMMTHQLGALPGHMPGWGFGYGGAVLVDPVAAQTPQSKGTWMWGGVYGHAWFVDPVREYTLVLLTNTALEGMIGRLPMELVGALYS